MKIVAILKNNQKRFATVWGALLLVAVLFSAAQIWRKPVFDTDIASLLPASEETKILHYANNRIGHLFERKLVFLIGAETPERAVEMARRYGVELKQSGLFKTVNDQIDPEQFEQLGRLWFRYHFSLLPSQERKWIYQDNIHEMKQSLLRKLHGFIPGIRPTEKDPLMLAATSLQERLLTGQAAEINVVDNMAVVSDERLSYVLIHTELAQSPFAIAYQEQMARLLAELAARFSHAEIISSGVLHHAIHGSRSAKTEMSLFSTLSMVAVALLLCWVFRSFSPFLVTGAVILCGAAMGFAACIWFFGKIHLMTLVFGTSLVGISVDYSLHFLAERYRDREWEAYRSLGHILPGITLGLITSVIGFSGVAFTPFPGLQQMAVFCAAGLIFCYGCVLCWYPLIFQRAPAAPVALAFAVAGRYLSLWSALRNAKVTAIMLIIGAMASATTILVISPKDDVRTMQTPAADLLKNDQKLAKLLGSEHFSSQFFVMTAPSIEALLVEQERLEDGLEALIDQGAISNYRMMANWLPSQTRQRKDYQALRSFVARQENELAAFLAQSGVPRHFLSRYASQLEEGGGQPLIWREFSAQPAAQLASQLYLGELDGRHIAVIALSGVKDVKALRQFAKPIRFLSLSDRVSDISEILSKYRVSASIFTFLAYVIICIFLIFRYGLAGGIRIIAPPALASLMALAVVAGVSGSYTLFNVVALLLVLGIGVDYTLFLQEAKKEQQPTMVAVLLSAMTTILSFGLLSFSETSAISEFGSTVVIGIILTFLLSPIAARKTDGM